ncbi:MAG: trigger factor, partial [Nakamurella sp.]
RALPDVDEEFAQLASEFDTVEELRSDLAEKILRVKNRTQAADARDKVLEALIESTEIPTPESIVEAEFSSRAHDAVHAFDHDEDALNAHVIGQGQTREEFDAELRESAVKSVKVQLLLDALAEANQVGVNQEEFTERVMFNSQRLGIAPEEYFQRLQEGNQLGAVFAEVRRGKALAAAVDQATVTNASGDVLDVGALFGIEAVEDDELAEQIVAEELAEEIVEEAVADEELIEEEVEEALEEEILEEALEEATGEELDAEAIEEAAADELEEDRLDAQAQAQSRPSTGS